VLGDLPLLWNTECLKEKEEEEVAVNASLWMMIRLELFEEAQVFIFLYPAEIGSKARIE